MENKFYPSLEELTSYNNLVYCTEDGCDSMFKSESNLNLHLAKVHKVPEMVDKFVKKDINCEFYCPVVDCIYNNSKCFKNLKNLKQHYLKVHSDKNMTCDKCNKGFPNQKIRDIHQEYCGINFKCCDCSAAYLNYESLVTHGRRKQHTILTKVNYKSNNYIDFVNCKVGSNRTSKKMDERGTKRKLVPTKTLSCTQVYLLTDDKSSQTDINCGGKKILREVQANQNIETQTCKHQPRACVETQTIGDYIVKKRSSELLSESGSNESLSRKNIKTQTASVTSISKSCNTSLNLNDFNFGEGDVEKTTLGTQTLAMLSNFLDINIKNETSASSSSSMDLNYEFINSSCQTSFDENVTFDETGFYNCNIETQTDLIPYDIDLLTSEIYSNMCTQTCDEIINMELTNIHTQTGIDDVLKSVGSQTMMTLNTNPLMTCRDSAHIETQTDAVFQQMLEEINA